MADFLTGHTYGSTEQVTNTKLHNQVNLASISNIQASELGSNILTSLPSAAGKVPPQNFWNIVTVTTNASLIDISTATHLKVYASTFCSLATFLNPRIGQEFKLIMQQASFPTILDTGAFKLNGNFIPTGQYSNITLVWDGSAYIELGRVTP